MVLQRFEGKIYNKQKYLSLAYFNYTLNFRHIAKPKRTVPFGNKYFSLIPRNIESLGPRSPHQAEGILKRRFDSGTHQMFLSTLQNNHRSFWICDTGQLGPGYHMIMVTALFSKRYVVKMFSVHTD